MKSNLYSNLFTRLLREDSFAGDAGAFGDVVDGPIYDPDSNINSGNKYAPDDHRNIFGNKKPTVQTRKGRAKTKKDKKKKKK